jgi:signal transduction histidine kinase
MEPLTRFLRRFEAWGTGLRYKFEGDIFFRTTLYVIALQVALILVSVVAFSWALQYTNQQIIDTISTHVSALIQHYPAAGTSTLPQSIDAIQNASVRYVFAGVILLAALFGVLLAYITLRPARSSLEYQKLFISNVAHELRTPLSTIKTSTEVMLLDESVPPSVRDTLNSTLEELDRISGIINNLLSLNSFLRPERMEFGNVDLRPVIDTVIERVTPLAYERTVEIRAKKNDYAVVWGNASALEQVISNILRNAIIYTPRDRSGRITISVHPDYRGMVVLSVTDNGIGIAQDDLFHIFEPFYRAESSRTRTMARTGSGLGLAIVSEIVRVHKGQIRIQSAVGKGTTVSILLPAGTTPLPEAAAEGEPADTLSEVTIDFSRGA